MIIRILLALMVLYALFWFVTQVQSKPPAQRRRYYTTLLLSALAAALILLAVTGRVHWIGALIGALLPVLRNALPLVLKMLPFLQAQRKAQAASKGNADGNFSVVDTTTLQMRMDHDSSTLSGKVKQGPFAGLALDAMELNELQQLLEYCRQVDKDSVELLLNYLRHRFGDNWEQPQAPPSGGEMSREQALAVLGLQPGASREQIIEAHRKLMQKLHPDRGGNDYLASQINRAKDILLGN